MDFHWLTIVFTALALGLFFKGYGAYYRARFGAVLAAVGVVIYFLTATLGGTEGWGIGWLFGPAVLLLLFSFVAIIVPRFLRFGRRALLLGFVLLYLAMPVDVLDYTGDVPAFLYVPLAVFIRAEWGTLNWIRAVFFLTVLVLAIVLIVIRRLWSVIMGLLVLVMAFVLAVFPLSGMTVWAWAEKSMTVGVPTGAPPVTPPAACPSQNELVTQAESLNDRLKDAKSKAEANAVRENADRIGKQLQSLLDGKPIKENCPAGPKITKRTDPVAYATIMRGKTSADKAEGDASRWRRDLASSRSSDAAGRPSGRTDAAEHTHSAAASATAASAAVAGHRHSRGGDRDTTATRAGTNRSDGTRRERDDSPETFVRAASTDDGPGVRRTSDRPVVRAASVTQAKVAVIVPHRSNATRTQEVVPVAASRPVSDQEHGRCSASKPYSNGAGGCVNFETLGE